MTVGNEGDFTVSGDEEDYDVIPVDVRLVQDATETKPVTADYGGYLTRIDIPDVTTNQPVLILNRAINRHRAIIHVTTLTGGATPAVLIDKAPGAIQQGFGHGYTMVQGDTLEIKNQQPLYAITVGVPTAVTVVILDERWESDTE